MEHVSKLVQSSWHPCRARAAPACTKTWQALAPCAKPMAYCWLWTLCARLAACPSTQMTGASMPCILAARRFSGPHQVRLNCTCKYWVGALYFLSESSVQGQARPRAPCLPSLEHVIQGGHSVLLSAGASPLFFGERAMQKLLNRKTKVASYYFDLNLVGDYWGEFAHTRHRDHS